MFLGFVGRTAEPGPQDPAGAWAAASAQTQACLDDPTLAATEFDGFSGRSTYEAAVGRFLCTDLVVHAWDLARATGQDESMPPADVHRVFAQVEAMGDQLQTNGVCGPPVEVPADAPEQDRLLGMLGRQP